MFRVEAYDNNNCELVFVSRMLDTKEEADKLVVVMKSAYEDNEDVEVSMYEYSEATYRDLIYLLAENNEDICPIYTTRHMNVDECFESMVEIDLSDCEWEHLARVEVYEAVMIELVDFDKLLDRI